jgi:hypothetical protein
VRPVAFHGSTVEAKIRKAWRKERRFFHSRGLCFLLLWALALILLDFLVDWLFLIPGYGRLILLGVNVVALGSVLWREWARHLRRYDPVRTALQVEGRHPELKSLLVSFVQISGDPAAETISSPALIRALQRETLEATRPLDFREIVSFRELQRIFLLSLAVIAFFAAISVNWSEHLRVLWLRMINPRATTEYPTRTQILAVTGDITAQQGDTVPIVATVGGVPRKSATLYVRPRDGNWETLVLMASEDGSFQHRFQEVYQNFKYRFRVGDAITKEFEVRVVPPPRIVDTRVRLRFPAYTSRKEETVDILNLEVPEGTEIEWELRCDLSLSEAKMILETTGEKETTTTKALTLENEGHAARLAMTPTDSFSYGYVWTERDHGYVYKEDVRFFVQLVPDMPPQAEIITPTEDLKATVQKKLAILWQGRDDYGIDKAWIVYAVNEGPEQKYPLGSFRDKIVERTSVWTLRDSIPKLKEGDILTYLVEVADSHAGKEGPYTSRSQTRHLYIVSIEEYRQYVAERVRKLITEVGALHKTELEADTEVQTIKDIAPEERAP